MTDPYRLKTRLPNGAEFEAEGTEDSVRTLFEKFLEAIKTTPAPAAAPVIPPPAAPREGGNGGGAPATRLVSVSQETLDRLFVLDNDGGVTLRALPSTQDRPADSLILLIYGYRALKNEQSVTGTELKGSARQSGIQIERIDRVLSPYDSFVTWAGIKKGRRYGLNNQGLRRAEDLMTQILG